MSMDDYIQTDRERRYVAIATELAEQFAQTADVHDQENTFPYENVTAIKAAGYHTLTVPEEFGGMGATISEMLLCQERLARGDAGTALGIGQHISYVSNIVNTQIWTPERYTWLCNEVVKNGALFNSAASEPATGSPSRGGKPTTTARRTDSGWVINGRKNFVTYAPALTYFVTSATAGDEDKAGNFLVYHDSPGVQVLRTWDTMGMRSSASDELELKDVPVPLDMRIQTQKTPEGVKPHSSGSLHFAVVYLGVAGAARDWIVSYVTDNGMSDDPEVKTQLGRLEIELLTARTILMDAARRCDSQPTNPELTLRLGAVKYIVTNTAIRVVDHAMQIAGDAGLDKRYPLQRYYRDVRAGLHNPPMDDAVINSLSKAALEAKAEQVSA